jgi:hypothetical protein
LVEFSNKEVIIKIYLQLSYKLFFKKDLIGSEHVYSLKNLIKCDVILHMEGLKVAFGGIVDQNQIPTEEENNNSCHFLCGRLVEYEIPL